MIFDTTPPIVSMPSDSGVTSSSSMSCLPLDENVRLNGCAERDDFVGIEFGVRLAPNSFADRCGPAECASIRRPARLRRSARGSSLASDSALTARIQRAIDDRPDQRPRTRRG